MKILFIGGTGVISYACSVLCIEKGFDLYLFIFISSASAYHKPPLKIPLTEETPLHNPFWSYSRGKIDCEKFLMKVFRENDFPVTVCRPSHTYDKTKIALYGGYTTLNRMMLDKQIIIHEDGNTLWTLTNSRDFAKGFIGLLGNSKTIGEAYHITSDEILTWNQIAETIAQKAGYDLNITYLSAEFISKYDAEWGYNLFGDKGYDAVFDNTKIKKIVPDFKAAIPYSEGVQEIIEWYSHKKNQIVNRELDSTMDKMIEEYQSIHS